ncbi:MAG: hypothetical protein WKG32_08890 [Gemmatimonadaceae bacterium]
MIETVEGSVDAGRGVRVDDVGAGRALDVLVAERVMEWVVGIPEVGSGTAGPMYFSESAGGYRRWFEVPPFSTNLVEAWGIIEQMKRDYGANELVWSRWTREFDALDLPSLSGAEAAAAICRAAVRAMDESAFTHTASDRPVRRSEAERDDGRLV